MSRSRAHSGGPRPCATRTHPSPPLKAGEALLKIDAPLKLHRRLLPTGTYKADCRDPRHGGGGTVRRRRPGVKDVKVGDKCRYSA